MIYLFVCLKLKKYIYYTFKNLLILIITIILLCKILKLILKLLKIILKNIY